MQMHSKSGLFYQVLIRANQSFCTCTVYQHGNTTTYDIHCCFTMLVNLNIGFPCYIYQCAEALVCHDQYLVKQATFRSDGCHFFTVAFTNLPIYTPQMPRLTLVCLHAFYLQLHSHISLIQYIIVIVYSTFICCSKFGTCWFGKLMVNTSIK